MWWITWRVPVDYVVDKVASAGSLCDEYRYTTSLPNMGFTNVVYCVMTPSTDRPRSTVSRFRRRAIGPRHMMSIYSKPGFHYGVNDTFCITYPVSCVPRQLMSYKSTTVWITWHPDSCITRGALPRQAQVVVRVHEYFHVAEAPHLLHRQHQAGGSLKRTRTNIRARLALRVNAHTEARTQLSIQARSRAC